MFKSDFLNEIDSRGFIYQSSEIEELKSRCSNSAFVNSIMGTKGEIWDLGHRVSESCYIDSHRPSSSEYSICKKIKNTITTLLPENKKIEIQMLRYNQGGFYNPHHDDFEDTPFEDNRKFTFFVILESDCQGGGTGFPNLQVTYKPKKGSAVFWNSFNPDRTRNINKLHGGNQVISGNKLACNIWVT